MGSRSQSEIDAENRITLALMQDLNREFGALQDAGLDVGSATQIVMSAGLRAGVGMYRSVCVAAGVPVAAAPILDIVGKVLDAGFTPVDAKTLKPIPRN